MHATLTKPHSYLGCFYLHEFLLTQLVMVVLMHQSNDRPNPATRLTNSLKLVPCLIVCDKQCVNRSELVVHPARPDQPSNRCVDSRDCRVKIPLLHYIAVNLYRSQCAVNNAEEFLTEAIATSEHSKAVLP